MIDYLNDSEDGEDEGLLFVYINSLFVYLNSMFFEEIRCDECEPDGAEFTPLRGEPDEAEFTPLRVGPCADAQTPEKLSLIDANFLRLMTDLRLSTAQADAVSRSVRLSKISVFLLTLSVCLSKFAIICLKIPQR